MVGVHACAGQTGAAEADAAEEQREYAELVFHDDSWIIWEIGATTPDTEDIRNSRPFPLPVSTASTRGGSSPRVRGKLVRFVCGIGFRRIIPACVGQTRL